VINHRRSNIGGRIKDARIQTLFSKFFPSSIDALHEAALLMDKRLT